MTLAGKRAIVTGGARGLGASIAQGFAEAGMQVVLMDVRDEAGLAMASHIGGTCRYVHCNVASQTSVDVAFNAAADILGGLDVLAAVAGLDRPGHAPENMPLAVWEDVMGVNATGTFLTNQAAYRLMEPGRNGRIINFASFAGIRGHRERPAYAAAKGAILAWTRSAALAWGPVGITVNAVAPQMKTEVAERYIATLDSDALGAFADRLTQSVPLGGRLGESHKDLVPFMLFLASEGSGFMTGQTFAVDGGMTMLGA